MPRPELDERFARSKLHRYLLADEKVVVAQRQHWAALWKPILGGVGGLLLVITANIFLPPSVLTDLLWWALLPLTIWAALKWVEWRHNWMAATDKRVMVNYGLLNQGVAMFSLSRVPDLTYTRSPLGRLLGFGELEREGTSGDLSLHKVKFVEHPHATYTTICAAIFELQDRMFGMDDDEYEHRIENAPPEHAPGLHAPYIPPEQRTSPITSRHDEDLDDESTGIKIHYGVSRHHQRDPWHQGTDVFDSTFGDSNTGPVPYRRSTTDEDADWEPTTNDRASDRDHDRGTDRDHHH
ncbi:MAG TPA: PH domain-containing protein [Dermatophilaceae bacterium]